MFFKHFSKNEIDAMKQGHIPQEMEDRWFAYFEDGKLYIHRSWPGDCIYIVKFNFLTCIHIVTVNRDQNQYTCTNIKEDKDTLEYLLKWLFV